MSDRERWIVYPLLFLALGAALRDKLAKKSVTEHLVCKQLTVVDENDLPVAQIVGLPSEEGGASTARLLVRGQVVADQVVASSAPKQPAPAAGTFTLDQLFRLLQQAGVRVTPGPAPKPAEPPGLGEPTP